MDENKSSKGFSGFDDLVSDVSKDLEQAKQAPVTGKATTRQADPAAPQRKAASPPDTGRDATPVYHSSTGSSSSGSAGKWVFGIIAVIIFFSWISSSGKKRKSVV